VFAHFKPAGQRIVARQVFFLLTVAYNKTNLMQTVGLTMLTRIKVSGFKNLVDVDVRFGPFTCIAGVNGAGKSNLFDAIRFLSATADMKLLDAALSVRDESARTTDIRSLFHRVGDRCDPQMSFEAEMIIPKDGYDDRGQKASASITFLRYTLILGYRTEEGLQSLGSLQIIKESLEHINLRDAKKELGFPHKKDWRESVISGRRAEAAFISTEGTGAEQAIVLHQDHGGGGRPLMLRADSLPRTVLSTSNASESPTVLLARREMQSWRLLQLEPSALRRPDAFIEPARLSSDGAHLAATFYRLGHQDSTIEAHVAKRLTELIDDVQTVSVDRDNRRELLTLQVTGKDGTKHPARALSDGTLRFLALTILELDPETQGLLCLEEPENGIHPRRIPGMLNLLQAIATDVDEHFDAAKPLRQVIVNTHSPSVVAQIPDDTLLIAEAKETLLPGLGFKHATFSYLPNTWREKTVERGDKPQLISKAELLAYLGGPNAELPANAQLEAARTSASQPHKTRRRVMDHPDLQMLLPFGDQSD
jgi:predicted ATPase